MIKVKKNVYFVVSDLLFKGNVSHLTLIGFDFALKLEDADDSIVKGVVGTLVAPEVQR